jgi:hypothetical protein
MPQQTFIDIDVARLGLILPRLGETARVTGSAASPTPGTVRLMLAPLYPGQTLPEGPVEVVVHEPTLRPVIRTASRPRCACPSCAPGGPDPDPAITSPGVAVTVNDASPLATEAPRPAPPPPPTLPVPVTGKWGDGDEVVINSVRYRYDRGSWRVKPA